MLRYMRPALIMTVLLTLLCGILYPLAVWGISRIAFTDRADGSFVERDGKLIGSRLIGQPFESPHYFWSRPSATAPGPYEASASTGSNLGPSNPAQRTAVEERIARLRASDPGNAAPIPIDLVTASGSGLDPHVSPAAALWQVTRVAHARKLDPDRLRRLVEERIEPRTFGILGEPRVNVLELNLALDALN